MTWIIRIKQFFGQVYFAPALPAQINERLRIVKHQRDLAGDLVGTAIELQIGCVHALKVERELFGGEQTLAQAVPIADLNEAGRVVAELVAVAALGALREIVRKLVRLIVGRGDLRHHPRVQLRVGVLGAQRIFDLLSVVDLQLLIVQLQICDRDLDLSCRDLLVDLRKFAGSQVLLKVPFVLTPVVAAEDTAH